MLDDLRNSAESGYLEEEAENNTPVERTKRKEKGPFLGMTAPQRFIIVLFLFMMVAILGVFILILFETIYPSI